MKPFLFLDVDGPLNPFAAAHRRLPGYLTRAVRPAGWAWTEPLELRLNPAHGERLRALAGRYELAWASTWEAEANTYVAPELGLPALPYVHWPTRTAGPDGTFWKLREVVAHAAGRPFAWVDDEVGPSDRAWVNGHYPAPAALLRIDPARGLVEEDFLALEEWAESL
ncbi:MULTISPECIES: HAD domain-containing protein [Streptomyces]|uniref:HAD domain-containing protein n=1 Tax=Streptomyces evansiae TaxID=3075535 RepID=A0ABU2R1H3_9ACTN|nr:MULTISPECIES: HAD domain-containing protein [unclassified Streptomyces]MDT0410546.1 HAD domain-containing protein [Streptomyces sp. DSM 41979]MYQ56714.1 hypothetical protein [Streptomyces sp. SID4926]